MTRLYSLLFIAALLFTASACGSAKPPTAPATQGNKVIASLQDLSSMYGKKNLSGFMRLISDGYKDRQELSAALEAVFAKYDTAQFTVQYSRMYITVEDKGMTRATFNWDGSWETKGGSVLKNSGRATFVFDPKDARLVSFDGKNPFLPQPAETPGKK